MPTDVRRILCLLFLVTAGCAHQLPVTGTLPKDMGITELATVAVGAPFALDPDGRAVAYANDGLRIRAPGVVERLVDTAEPTAVAWSPDGKQLAASFARGDGAVVRLYDRQGTVRAETGLEGRAGGLAWRSPGELLAFSVKLRRYGFGVNIAETLYRWDGKGAATATELYQATLRRGILGQWERVFRRTLNFALSPFGDEILYAQVHDPPMFAPYLRLVLHRLDNDREREAATVSPYSAGCIFSGTGESALCGDGENESRFLDLWGNRVLATIPSPGRSAALSPGGRYYLLDGQLYRDGAAIASFPAGSVGAFAPRGRCLAVRSGARLYLVAGLQEEPVFPGPAQADRLRQLRKWLSEELISDKEYRDSQERIGQ